MSCKWIFKIKYNANSFVAMHKVHLHKLKVLISMKPFSHVAQMESIQVVFVIATIENFEVHQMNVKTIF
jgi:hypothetical protein